MKPLPLLAVALCAGALLAGGAPGQDRSAGQGDAAASARPLIEDLCRYLSHPNPRVRFAVREALRTLGRASVSAIRRSAAAERNPHVKSFIHRVLVLVEKGRDRRRRPELPGLPRPTRPLDDVDWLATELDLSFEQIARLQPLLERHVKAVARLQETFRTENDPGDLQAWKRLFDTIRALVEKEAPSLRSFLDAKQVAHLKEIMHWCSLSSTLRSPERRPGARAGGEAEPGDRQESVGQRREKDRPAGRRALERALEWLAHAQRDDGGWSAGRRACDVGVTGLALLAFVGDGHTYRPGRYRNTVEAAIKFLRRALDPEGCIGPRQGPCVWNHAIATAGLCELFGATRSPLLRRWAERSVAFLLRAQADDPKGGGKLGWGEAAPSRENDVAATGWAVIALRAARHAGIEVPDEAFAGALRWLDRATGPRTGRAATIRGGGKSPRAASGARTAVALFCRILAGAASDGEPVREATAVLLQRLPAGSEDGAAGDHAWWHQGTLALVHVGGEAWRTWHSALTAAACATQRPTGDAAGSWNPTGPWGSRAGRAGSTAMVVLSLEAPRRYGPPQ